MVRVARVLAFFGLAASAGAHPAVSVVIDSRGNVYWSDLKQVWRLDAEGRKSVAVPGVHTHELALDAQDNLYGEHLWYEGERTDRWGHYVWKRSPDGAITRVIPSRQGFLRDYSFVRDRTGAMYWVDDSTNMVRKRLPDGRVVDHARGSFRDVRWMTATPEGIVYLIDTVDLARVGLDGAVHIVARDLSGRRLGRPLTWMGNMRHFVQGLWPGQAGDVYVADNAGSQVKRVRADGAVEVVAHSRAPWSPTGGALAPDGALWVLEYAPVARARVRRIEKDGRETVY